MSNALDEPLIVKQLRQQIEQKNGLLRGLVEELEQMRVDLSLLRREYTVRVGDLYLQLDLLALKLKAKKKIKELIEKGIEPEKAASEVDAEFQELYEKVGEQFNSYAREKEHLEKRNDMSDEEKQKLRQLWKKLAHKFHPDFAKTIEERGQFERVMKEINRAYTDGNLELLEQIEREEIDTTSQKVATEEDLKKQLSSIEHHVKEVEREKVILENSEWYAWKTSYERALRVGRDLLSELEDRLRMDIKERERQLANEQ